MPKIKSPVDATDGLNISSRASCDLSPEALDLLNLQSLDDHPSMAPSLGAKEPLSDALVALEEQMRVKTRNLAFYSKSPNEATATELMAVARTELATLERERTQLMGELRQANESIEACRAETREEIIPELSQLVVPEIDARLRTLDLIDAAQRLVGKASPARAVREAFRLEQRYLQELRAVLTEGR